MSISKTIDFNNSTINIGELSAYTEKGLLEATASISQLPQRQAQISLNGRGVPMTILQQWGWPALPLSGDGNIQLTASGNIQADAPLKPTVSGQLHAVNAGKQQVTQTMQAGGGLGGGGAAGEGGGGGVGGVVFVAPGGGWVRGAPHSPRGQRKTTHPQQPGPNPPPCHQNGQNDCNNPHEFI